MKLENQCATIEQSKRLKELGVVQESLCCFMAHGSEFKGDEPVVINNFFKANPDSFLWASAFTVAELGAMLPHDDYEAVSLRFFKDGALRFFAGVSIRDDDGVYQWGWKRWFNTEAEARADTLIYLLESGKIQASQVNARLTS